MPDTRQRCSPRVRNMAHRRAIFHHRRAADDDDAGLPVGAWPLSAMHSSLGNNSVLSSVWSMLRLDSAHCWRGSGGGSPLQQRDVSAIDARRPDHACIHWFACAAPVRVKPRTCCSMSIIARRSAPRAQQTLARLMMGTRGSEVSTSQRLASQVPQCHESRHPAKAKNEFGRHMPSYRRL